MTKPSRSRSHGRDARAGSSLRVLSAFIAENPARPMGMIEASEPPARKISASPNLIMRHDSPIALFEVAQAVTMHRFGPCKPNSIEMTPLAMLLIIIGMVNGETRDGPLFIKIGVLVLERLEAADSAADDHAEAIASHLSRSIPQSPHRDLRGPHGQMGEAIRAANVLRIVEEILSDQNPRTSPPIRQS